LFFILHNLKPHKPYTSGPQNPAFGAVEIQEYPPSSGGASSCVVLQLGSSEHGSRPGKKKLDLQMKEYEGIWRNNEKRMGNADHFWMRRVSIFEVV
jgi:hypothetical protein